MAEEEKYYQLLGYDAYGMETLVNWFNTEEEAQKELEWRSEAWPDEDYWIEEGTHHITRKCRGCETPNAGEKHDAHGISTGIWCQTCYDSDKYPYRKDRYPTIETHGYGERLDDDY